MLCGFGSGKTTYARALEAKGCVRLSLDERVFERDGRHGIDDDESELVGEHHLDEFLTRWHPAHGEGEEVLHIADP